jgi:hypothetical protein
MVKTPIIHQNEFAGLQFFRENGRTRRTFIKVRLCADEVFAFDTKYADKIESILMNSFRGRFTHHVWRGNNPDLMDADFGCCRIDFGEINESRNQRSKLRKAYQLIFQFGKIAFDAAGELIYSRTLLKILMFQPLEILRCPLESLKTAPSEFSLHVRIEGKIQEVWVECGEAKTRKTL